MLSGGDTVIVGVVTMAKDGNEAAKLQIIPEGPHGKIHLDGTIVCMDVDCACGRRFHVDAEFAFEVKCPHCKSMYLVNSHVQLIPIEEEGPCCVLGTSDVPLAMLR